jgi:SNF2 family DNA or RNA helicase
VVRPFVLRRLKSDVLKQMVPKREIVIKVNLEADQRAVYNGILAKWKESQAAKSKQVCVGGAVRQRLLSFRFLNRAYGRTGFWSELPAATSLPYSRSCERLPITGAAKLIACIENRQATKLTSIFSLLVRTRYTDETIKVFWCRSCCLLLRASARPAMFSVVLCVRL